MKLKLLILLLLAIYISGSVPAQAVKRPKLIVGIVVDQMRYDYLYKFNQYFSKDGFNRLLNEGTNFTYAHYNYVPTYTAPGHASIYTGASPAVHGIISNSWYDKTQKKIITSVSDKNYKSVGSEDKEGEKSPKNLLSTTISDQLKLATNGASKVISISIKDRASILPGGYLADAAIWYDEKTGNFISSDFYMKSLPQWVEELNKRKIPDSYLTNGWQLLRKADDYAANGVDDSPFENDIFSEGKTSFPHLFNNLKKEKKYEAIPATPCGNELIKELAIAALVNEKLGQGKETDFLAVSFSSTDYVGHAYGTNSYEIEDIYLRLDLQIAELLAKLDLQVGKGNYLLFLTADHAAEDTPGLLKKKGLPTGELNYDRALDSLKTLMEREYGNKALIENFSNNQVFLNRELIKKNNLNIHEIEQKIADYLRDTFTQIASIFTRDNIEKGTAKREPDNYVVNGFNTVRSGDVAITLQPGFLMSFQEKGTTHGASYSYDTHVPLLFYGWNIPAATVNTPVYIVDIAPTVCNLVRIEAPSGCLGVPVINERK